VAAPLKLCGAGSRARITRENHFEFALDLALNYGFALVYFLLLLSRERRKRSDDLPAPSAILRGIESEVRLS
jgi:hypothetical protein